MTEFYVYGSVHRWSTLIFVQRDATQRSLFIILQVHSTYFGCQQHPSSGVHKTVTTASGTGHIFCAATLEGGSRKKIWPVPEAVITVSCTPDDGCGWHPKHVEWTCRIINRLLCVASRWTLINIYLLAEFKHPVIKSYGGSGGIAPYDINFNLGTRRTLNVRYRLRPLYSRENGLWYKLENRFCDVNIVHGRDEEETNPYKIREVKFGNVNCGCGCSILDNHSFMKHLHVRIYIHTYRLSY